MNKREIAEAAVLAAVEKLAKNERSDEQLLFSLGVFLSSTTDQAGAYDHVANGDLFNWLTGDLGFEMTPFVDADHIVGFALLGPADIRDHEAEIASRIGDLPSGVAATSQSYFMDALCEVDVAASGLSFQEVSGQIAAKIFEIAELKLGATNY